MLVVVVLTIVNSFCSEESFGVLVGGVGLQYVTMTIKK